MRLLIYCDDPGYGGTAVNAGLLAAGLAGQGLAVTVAASADITGQAPGVGYVPIDYDTMRTFGKTVVSRNEPEAILLAVRPDLVVFCDGAPDSSLAAKAVCRDFGLPYLVHVNYVAPAHVTDIAARLPQVVAANQAAVAVAAVSQENLDLLRRFFGAPPERSGVIHYGRPEAFFQPTSAVERRERREALGLLPGDMLCLTVARYEPRKGYRHLLRAVSLLAGPPAGMRLRFAAIGHSIGDGRRVLEDQIAAAGLAGRVTLLGQRDDVRQWLGAADCFVLPSESEGMPLSVTEAMGQGLPVVASAVSGIPEQLGDAGILLPDPNADPEATAQVLAQALAALADDPEARSRLGRAARQRALAHFTAPAMIRAWMELLRAYAPGVLAARPRFPDPAGYVPRNAAPLGRDIALGDDAAAGEFLKEGWSHGEGEGRWTEGSRARLALALPDAARGGFVLELAGRAFLGSGDAPMTLVLSVNGRAVGRFVWPGAPERLDLALACLPPAGEFWPQQAYVVLSIEGASSPAAWGLSDDPRLLGLFVTRVRVAPLRAGAGGWS